MKKNAKSVVRYAMKDRVVDKSVRDLVRKVCPSADQDLIYQMVTTALKLQDEHVDRGDLKILNASLKELRYAFRVFKPFRHFRKVSIFGSARLPDTNPAYKMAKQFGKLMTESGWMSITGASTGIMRAGHEGAGRAASFGANIRLPFEQAVNSTIENDKKLIHFKYFFTRKLIFVKESDAICLFPGGFGTLDEGCEVMTLVQTGKSNPRPIVLVEPKKDYYWEGWLHFVKRYILARKMIEPADLSLLQLVTSAEAARDVIIQFYKNYHSMRFVGEHLILRLQHPIDKSDVKRLNDRFSDILTGGKITTSGPLVAEAGEEPSLPRLILKFNRRGYSRLKQMIDTINEFH